MKYLKIFENHSAYEAAQSGLILPNVSLCVQENEVHYNPYTPPTPTETRLVCKYNVEYTEYETQLCSDTTNFSAMEIDGVEQAEVVTAYTFDSLGEHIVKYTLTDSTSIGNEAFYGCNSLANIVIPNSVTSIGDNVFENCYSLTSCTIGSGVTNIGGFVFYSTNLDSITSLATTAPLIIADDTFNGLTYNGTLYVPIGSSGYDRWMDDMDALGRYGWTKVEQ